MKKYLLPMLLASAFSLNSMAVDVTATAVATWSATAKKDSTSKLVVTPLGSLAFDYAEGVKGFNTQKGLFDVSIEGDDTATAFKLESKLRNNTLTALGGSGSTLSVGVAYNGEALSAATPVAMIDTAAGNMGGALGALAAGYNQTGRVSAQDSFTFSIDKATSNGTTPVTDMALLPDGVWSGDVAVEFTVTWVTA